MRVRVYYTVEVDDRYRRAINLYYGKAGLATRDEVKDFLRWNGGTCDDDLLSHHRELDELEKNEDQRRV